MRSARTHICSLFREAVLCLCGSATRSVAAVAVATGVGSSCIMEKDKDDDSTDAKELQPGASAHVQAQATIRPTYHTGTDALPAAGSDMPVKQGGRWV